MPKKEAEERKEEEEEAPYDDNLADFVEMVMSHPNFPQILQFSRDWRTENTAREKQKEKSNAKFGKLNLVIRGVLLLCALVAIILFGVFDVIEGQALVVLIAAYIGYLCGDRSRFIGLG